MYVCMYVCMYVWVVWIPGTCSEEKLNAAILHSVLGQDYVSVRGWWRPGEGGM